MTATQCIAGIIERLTTSQTGADTAAALRLPLPADPWEFLSRCCVTYDDRAAEVGLPPERAFPDKPHLQVIAEEFKRETHLAVDKSSQIMVTWLFAGLILHQVLLRRGQRIAWYCLTYGDALDHVRSRVYRLYLAIPAQYERPSARLLDGEFHVHHDGLDAEPTSRIVPRAAETGAFDSAAIKLRSYTWTGVFEDESAFYPGGEELHASILPRTGRYWKVSTPNGHSALWRVMYHDLNRAASQAVAPPEKTEIIRGVWGWRRNGFRCLQVNYCADPDKDSLTHAGAAWHELPAQLAAKANTRKWRREMENDSSVAAGVPVYSDTERIVQSPQVFRPNLKLFCGWDFGFCNPFFCCLQVEPVKDNTGKVLKRVVHVLKELHQPDTLIQAFAEGLVLPYLKTHFPGAEIVHYGDPAGHQRSDKTPETSISILRVLGVIVRTMHSEIDPRIDLVQDIISQGCMEIDPVACPTLVASMCGGYYRDDRGRPVKDGVHDHGPDALGEAMKNIFGLGRDRPEDAPRVYHPPPFPSAIPPPGQLRRAGPKIAARRTGDERPKVYRPPGRA